MHARECHLYKKQMYGACSPPPFVHCRSVLRPTCARSKRVCLTSRFGRQPDRRYVPETHVAVRVYAIRWLSHREYIWTPNNYCAAKQQVVVELSSANRCVARLTCQMSAKTRCAKLVPADAPILPGVTGQPAFSNKRSHWARFNLAHDNFSPHLD